ncbi:MAG: sarcosine oxidase subunit delta [Hyphomonadaceae bacterium]
MRIPCPFCGERDGAEFACRGEARRAPALADGVEAHFDYLYQRENPRGRVREFWRHEQGCRAWLVVERDTRTHEIYAAHLAKTP